MARIQDPKTIRREQRGKSLLRRAGLVFLVMSLVFAATHANKQMFADFIERNFIFFPTRRLTFSPNRFGMNFEDVHFTTPDGVKLHGWMIRSSAESPTILWFHGNAGNIADRLENARLLYDRGLSLFMMDYRGYGRSEGSPTEEGIYIDGQAAYEYLMSQGTRGEDIVIFGRSLGSSVATYVASRNECGCVILESAFTNMAEMARVHYPIIPGLGSFKSKFNSIDRIPSIKAPILFVHGDADEIVPYELGRILFDAAGTEKEFYTVPGAHHNDTYVVGGKEYFDKFQEYIDEKIRQKKTREEREKG